METLKFVIVGHVDHGKSTLIGRLLYDTNSISQDKIEEVKKTSSMLGRETEFAYLLDHLEEERRQGITIDTAQVFFHSDKRHYVIIDAPGHVEFVKNMITGASQADMAILIIDVKEGIKEQTRRHAYILSLLGIVDIIVVVNKMDLVGFSEERFSKIREELTEILASINISPIYFIPISAKNGDNIINRSEGMKWYKGPSVLEALDSLEVKITRSRKSLVFPIQDVYRIDSKRIIVGRLESGIVEVGQKVGILPGHNTTKIKSIEKFLEKIDTASKGECIGITTEEPLFLDRGNIICDTESDLKAIDSFKANIFWMSKKDFDRGERIIIRCVTQEIPCKIEKIERKIDSATLAITGENVEKLKNLEVGEVLIKTKSPIVVEKFSEFPELGRFVFVKDANICAGGIVTEA